MCLRTLLIYFNSKRSLAMSEDIHNVKLDGAGWHNVPRLTCYTCEGKTLLMAPYMTLKQWRDKVIEFAKVHPSDVVESYRDRMTRGE